MTAFRFYFLCRKSGILSDLGSTVALISLGLLIESPGLGDGFAAGASVTAEIGEIIGCTGGTVAIGVIGVETTGVGTGVG